MSNDSVLNFSEKFLTETDKLVGKLDTIITAIRGKEGPIDYKAIKDGFDTKRFKVNEKLKEAETFMVKRDKIVTSTIPKEIYERKQLESSIEKLLDEVDRGMKELDDEIAVQKKKKGKYCDFSKKEEIKNLMMKKYQILRSRLDGVEVEEKDIKENKTQIEQLEEILKKEGGDEKEREIYEEEQNKIDEWKKEIKEQDEGLKVVGQYVNRLKGEVNKTAEAIDDVHKKVKKVDKHTDKTTISVESQNKKLKDLLEKIRGSDKICVDILLFLVLLGLAAVLYSILKNKFF